MTSRVSIYLMCCKCYKLSALAAVDGNSTFLNFTLKVARRNGVNCNKQFSMVIIMHFFFLSQAKSVVIFLKMTSLVWSMLLRSVLSTK